MHLRVEVGRKGVIVPLVVLLLTSLPVLLGVFLGIVRLSMILQMDWMDPFLLILIIIVIHSNSLNGESSLSDLFAGPLPCLRDCSSSSHSSMAHSLSLMMLGEVALLDLLACGVFLFLGGTTHSREPCGYLAPRCVVSSWWDPHSIDDDLSRICKCDWTKQVLRKFKNTMVSASTMEQGYKFSNVVSHDVPYGSL